MSTWSACAVARTGHAAVVGLAKPMPSRLASAGEVKVAPGVELLTVTVDEVAVRYEPSKSVSGKVAPNVGLPTIAGPLKSGSVMPHGRTVPGIESPLCVPWTSAQTSTVPLPAARTAVAGQVTWTATLSAHGPERSHVVPVSAPPLLELLLPPLLLELLPPLLLLELLPPLLLLELLPPLLLLALLPPPLLPELLPPPLLLELLPPLLVASPTLASPLLLPELLPPLLLASPTLASPLLLPELLPLPPELLPSSAGASSPPPLEPPELLEKLPLELAPLLDSP
jgi:hypothetical protein